MIKQNSNTAGTFLPTVLCAITATLLSLPPADARQQDTPAGLLPLTETFEAEFEAAQSAIALQRQDAASIEGRIGAADGVLLEILTTRLERDRIALMEQVVGFAETILARREDGFDVGTLPATAIELLQSNMGIAETLAAQMDARTVFPESDLNAARQAAAYRSVFEIQRNRDRIDSLTVDGFALLRGFSVDVSDAEAAFEERLRERAINVSVYLDLAAEDAAGIRAGLNALPGDPELTAKLAVANSRILETAGTLERVVDELNAMGVPTASYRQQLITTTGEITPDLFDFAVIGSLLTYWGQTLMDSVASNGPTWLLRALIVALILFVSLRLARIARTVVERGVDRSNPALSQLLRRMIVSVAANAVLAIGVLFALSQLGVSLGPLLAGLGIAGFVIGFALQDSLSNFASGLMILFYRPFDVGDIVEVGGVTGRVEQMSLVNTTVDTFDNQRIILPNTMIWGGVIKNVTSQKLRRVDMVFGISYADDIEKTERILHELVEGHELVLDDPEPIIRLHELADSSVNFAVRPWTETENYWNVYWDLTRAVKMRFDEAGISIPFPQRDVHVITEGRARQTDDPSVAAAARGKPSGS